MTKSSHSIISDEVDDDEGVSHASSDEVNDDLQAKKETLEDDEATDLIRQFNKMGRCKKSFLEIRHKHHSPTKAHLNDDTYVCPSVFVACAASQNLARTYPSDSDVGKAAWKANVAEIRSNSRATLVAVDWYYSIDDIVTSIEGVPEEFREIQVVTAPYELFSSNHRNIIPASVILDVAHINVYDDSDLTPKWIAFDHYFTRATFTLSTPPQIVFETTSSRCPVCRQRYDPIYDNQIFCQGCKNWFHVGCIEESPEERPQQPDDTLLGLVLAAPVMRGLACPFGKENEYLSSGSPVAYRDRHWLLTGAGLLVNLAMEGEMAHDEELPVDWMVSVMGEGWTEDERVSTARNYEVQLRESQEKMHHFLCPCCNSLM
ncbi:hypothetical protein BDZ89DRAFT_1146304 [Hymenopellis radicata]|nr:hypothetical protein BDZ89DRAFT_1146304 [Hymenopellis radicata]